MQPGYAFVTLEISVSLISPKTHFNVEHGSHLMEWNTIKLVFQPTDLNRLHNLWLSAQNNLRRVLGTVLWTVNGLLFYMDGHMFAVFWDQLPEYDSIFRAVLSENHFAC